MVVIDLVGALNSSATTSLTFNHTASGAGRYVFIFIMDTNAVAGVSTVTGVTYAGTAMGTILTNIALTATQVMSAYGMFAPPTGLQSVVITRTGSGGNLYAEAVSLNGADQAAGINASSGSSVFAGSTTGTATLTTTVDNCGIVMYTQNTAVSPGAGTGSTLLSNTGGVSIFESSVFPFTPPGVANLSWSQTGGSGASMIVALSPFGTTVTTAPGVLLRGFAI